MATSVNDQTLSMLRNKLREMMNNHADHIATGRCVDFAEYRHAAGVIEGLALAESELLDLDERLNQE